MEQKGLDDTRNLLGLVDKLLLPALCSVFVKRVSYQTRSSSWTMPLAILLTLLKSEHFWTSVFLHAIKHHFFNQWTEG